MLTLSIIIVNWNTRNLLAQCLDSIRQTSGDLPVEVIVVDNASTDGSQTMLQQSYPEARLLANSQNVGFARANNQAIAVAQGRYFLLLNSDTIVLPQALARLVSFANQQNDAGIVGGKLLNSDGSLQESWASFPTFWSEMLGRNFRTKQMATSRPLSYKVDWVGGACLLARPTAIAQAGGLDESFFMYAEETDWCFQMRRHGWQVYYLPEAEVIHLGGGSASRSSAGQLIRLYQSKIHFFSKNYGAAQATALRYGLVVTNLLGLAKHSFRPNNRDLLTARTALIKNLWRGEINYADRH